MGPTGALDMGFNPLLGIDLVSVECLAVQGDGRIVIAGIFTSVAGQPRNSIARLEATGAVDATFVPGTQMNDFVAALAVQADGKMVLGGTFAVPGGDPKRLLRLLATGAVEGPATFDPGTGPRGAFYGTNVGSIALQADGRMIIGGYFTEVNGHPRDGLARLGANGALESANTFDPGSGPSTGFIGTGVQGVALQQDGAVLVMGSFATVDGQAHNGLARLINYSAPQVLTTPGPAQVRWTRAGAAPEVEPVLFDFTTDVGNSYTVLGVGTRIPNGWELNGVSLPAHGLLRARGLTRGGAGGNGSGIIEQFLLVGGPPPSPPITDPPIAPPPFPPIEIWRGDTFGADAGNPAIAGNNADPDHDGIVNLLEYAFGSRALDPSSVPRLGGQPIGSSLQFFYEKRVSATDIVVGILKSSWRISAFHNC